MIAPRRIGVTALIALAIASAVRAQSLPNAQVSGAINRRALLVSGSEDAPDRTQAANELAAILDNSYGFAVTRLEARQATREAITAALQRVAGDARPQDLVFVLLDLPVQMISGTSFLVPSDGNREQPQTLMRRDEAVIPLTKLGATSSFVILPACGGNDRVAQMNAKAFESALGTTRSGVSLLTYCPATRDAAVPPARILLEILRRPYTGESVVPDTVADALHGAMPTADVILHTGYFTWARRFAFDPVRDRLASDLAALASPTPDAITRAVRSATESPADQRTADIDRVSVAIARVAENRAQPAATRSRAVQALGQLGSKSSVSALARVATAGESDAALRKAAVEAVGRIGGAEATPIVRARLKDNDASVREAAVRAVAGLRDAGSEAAVAEMLRRDASEPVRVAAVQALTLLQARREGRAALVAALKDVSPVVRRETANALGGVSADVASELIAAYRAERDPTVQQALIYALSRVPHNLTAVSQIEVLLRTAARSESATVREAAIFSLGSFGSSEAKAIVQGGLDDESERVQAAAMQSAARQRNAEAVPQLVRFLEGKPPDVRSAAVESLGRIGDLRAVDALVGRLKDDDEYVRTSAQRWLSTLQAGAALGQALADPSAQVQLRAINAIGPATGDVPVAALVQALGDEDYEVRSAAIRVVSKVIDEDDIVLVIDALRSPQPLVEASALEVIGNLAARQPRPNLNDAETLVEDLLRRPSNPAVFAEAVRTAGKLGGQRWLAPILTAASSDDAAVRRAAAESLGRYSAGDGIEALRRLAKDPVLDVQAAAIDSLRRLNVK